MATNGNGWATDDGLRRVGELEEEEMDGYMSLCEKGLLGGEKGAGKTC